LLTTTAVGLITNNDETAYREEVRMPGQQQPLYVSKTKELIAVVHKRRA
jgi:hypothetical protein